MAPQPHSCNVWGSTVWEGSTIWESEAFPTGPRATVPSSRAYLLTVPPGGLASGTQPRRFQNGIRCSAAAGGREGEGRGGGPASRAVLRWAIASSCLRCECGCGPEWVSPQNARSCLCHRPGLGRVLPFCHPQLPGMGSLASPSPSLNAVTVAARRMRG